MSLIRAENELPFAIDQLSGLTQDSRKVQPGFLFAAFKGQESDGRDYINQAIDNGASVILTHADSAVNVPEGVALILDENPRAIFAGALKAFYKNQPERIVAVTGTNGKTSVAYFVHTLWQAMGLNSASLGTLGVQGSGNKAMASGMTTPDAETLHQNLAMLVNEQQVTHLVIEASSHGLDQYRMDGLNVQAAGFTNLTRDHLDYHKTADAYFEAKTRLFSEVLAGDGVAILNADEEHFSALLAVATARGIKVFSYGQAGEDLKVLSCKPVANGLRAEIVILGEAHNIHVPLVGMFQLHNLLCALGLVLSEGQAKENVPLLLKAIEQMKTVPGRLQRVSGHPLECGIYVDYAHTPDALETVLKSLRPHTENRLFCVFGCGGDRDKGKRPMMGEVVSRLADHVIVTDDNPRSENAGQIRKEILAGAPDALDIEGRARAIGYAVQNLSNGDVLLVAGKGHEQGQIFADHTEPFDDVEEVQKALSNIQSLGGE